MKTHALSSSRRMAAVLLAIGTSASVAASGDWQLQRLMEPSAAQRAQEIRGSVVIYDGLDAGLVAQAMDEHFDRIQNMMFVRIHHLPPSGAGGAVIEDDGCD
ncbi:MAG: hypothetical protein KDI82_10825 [Gammaproteobacteria bacterium]|nr:hypothetical protein [Gammaproteobacteria bacterium]